MTQFFDQRLRRESLASGLEPIVNEEHAIGWCNRSSLESQLRAVPSIVRGRRSDQLLTREQTSLLPDRNEAGPKLSGDCTANQESTRLDAGDLRHP